MFPGVELPNSSVGVYAPDTDVYNTFWELMEPIICSLFNLKRSTIYQPPSHMTGIGDVTLDPDGKYILSSRIRLARNLEGYPLPALSSREVHIHTVRCRYNAANFLQNPHNRHPIARPGGVCFDFNIWFNFCHCHMEYRDKLDRVITALDCTF